MRLSRVTEYLVLVLLILTCDKKYTLVDHYVEKLLLIVPLFEDSVQPSEHKCPHKTLTAMVVAV